MIKCNCSSLCYSVSKFIYLINISIRGKLNDCFCSEICLSGNLISKPNWISVVVGGVSLL